MFGQKINSVSTARQKVDNINWLRRVIEGTNNFWMKIDVKSKGRRLVAGILFVWRKMDVKNRLRKTITEIKRLWEKYDGTNKLRRMARGIQRFLLKQKVNVLNNIREMVNSFQFFCRRIDGINIWRVSRIFTQVAHSRENLEERMFNGNLVIQLDPKNKRELIDSKKKREIENEIRKLEGFQIFRLCLLEDCQIEYKESMTQFGTTRWLEIPVNIKGW